MMATESEANLELAKALLEARAIALKLAMEDTDRNLFRLAVMGFDLRLLDEFRKMLSKTSDKMFMTSIQLDVAGSEKDELRNRYAALESKQAQILNAIAIWEACLPQIMSPDYPVFDTGTLELLTMVADARSMGSSL